MTEIRVDLEQNKNNAEAKEKEKDKDKVIQTENQEEKYETIDSDEETEEHQENYQNGTNKKVERVREMRLRLCAKREECIEDTISIGTKCGKLHMEKGEFEEIKKTITEKNKNTETEKKEKMKTEYCKHHMYGRKCRFRDECWKKHITLEDYLKTIKCKYNETEGCRQQRWCKFKHEKNARCTFYDQGKCNKEDWCEYKHIAPETKKNTTEIRPTETTETKEKSTEQNKTMTPNTQEQNFHKDSIRDIEKMLETLTKGMVAIKESIEMLKQEERKTTPTVTK